MIPVLAFVQHYKKFYTSQFESAAVRHGLNQLEIDILLFLHNNPDCRTASDICRYRGLAKSNVSKAVEHLRTILLEMDDCANRGDLRQFTDCDTLFHRAIIDATGNQVLLKLWEQCNMRNWFRFSALTDATSLRQLQSGHQQILEAICARDVKTATSMLEDHLTGLMDGFIRGVKA